MKTVEAEGILGDKYLEHFDDDGVKIGESRMNDGLLGKYMEHFDCDGNKIGESKEIDGFFGAYVEHRSGLGDKVGESRDREGVFEDYVEHRDAGDRVVGTSVDRDGLFGKYKEHRGSVPYLGQEQSDQAEQESGGGIFDTLGEYAAIIGFVIGAIGGFADAVGSVESIGGYALYTIGYGIGVAFVFSVMAAMLPYALALGALVLVLKACGIA